jgi:dTDP-4-dehydrorhamnose reductase
VTKKNILLTGGGGQLGSTFSAFFKNSILNEKYELNSVDLEHMDFADDESILSALEFYTPSIILNCGAYTSVDNAEKECDLAFKINDLAVSVIAKWAKKNDSRLVHISTDFVFDGRREIPYKPGDHPNPLGIYGQTKLGGERHILRLLPENGIILRTSWLYSEFGQNFVKTMLALMSEKKELGVVGDQLGSPTSTHSLVKILFKIIENENSSGIFHWCDGAAISWYDFALEIQRQGFMEGILNRKIPIKRITTSSYPTLAERPSYSVLDCKTTLGEFKINNVDWKKELSEVVAVISKSS